MYPRAVQTSDAQLEQRMREICREEIASLAGKALRRTQDLEFTRSSERNLAMQVANEQSAQFWGEVLAEYAREQADRDEAEERLAGWPVPEDRAQTVVKP